MSARSCLRFGSYGSRDEGQPGQLPGLLARPAGGRGCGVRRERPSRRGTASREFPLQARGSSSPAHALAGRCVSEASLRAEGLGRHNSGMPDLGPGSPGTSPRMNPSPQAVLTPALCTSDASHGRVISSPPSLLQSAEPPATRLTRAASLLLPCTHPPSTNDLHD